MQVQFHTTKRSGRVREACPGCGLHAWLRPAGLDRADEEKVEALSEHRRPVKRDHYLIHAGAPLERLYFVNSGSLKSTLPDAEGRLQLVGFSLPGEIVGMSAIGTGLHPGNTIALEDSSCCSVHYVDLIGLCQHIPALQHHLHGAMSRKIRRNYELMLMLGSMHAEERLVNFLFDLSHRHAARGYSGSQFRLSMTRQDIGSYLGLKLETISRLLASLSHDGMLEVNGREITLKDIDALKQVGEGTKHYTRALRKSSDGREVKAQVVPFFPR
jgi:CRP/FNR family transcriptional regulator